MTRLLSRRSVTRPSGLIVPGPPANTPSGFAPTDGNLPGWDHLGTEVFDKACPLGSFPGQTYAQTIIAHNNIEDTSKDYGRPVGYRGVYNSLKTCWVDPDSGVLRIRCYVDAAGQPQVAQLVPRFPVGTAEYGENIGRRYSAVLRCASVVGRGGAMKFARLNWPTSNNWKEGEFNFPEAPSTGEIEFFSHRTDGDPSQNAWQGRTGAFFSAWHRFDSMWLPAFGPHPPRLAYILDLGAPGQQSWTIPIDRVPFGVPLGRFVQRLQFESWLSGSLVPAGTEVLWELDHVEEWSFNPATFDQTTYDLVR